MLGEKKHIDHFLVPLHEILPKEEAEKVMVFYKSPLTAFPKINDSDPIVKQIGAQVGDMIKITRKDATCENVYYRVVYEK
ncbi:DNA-directed RNA polymerase subunit H [Candidatus Gugararchaeum adminiculabundum]|nr:DNA-directed RNA polymerase subunit H [Candidatus Gugararchaeum adminiculabundum]